MRDALTKVLRLAAGTALGYAAYSAVVFCEVALKFARVRYFDKEELFYGVLSPIGGVWGYATGHWNYPLWVHLHDLLAYVLIVGGAALMLRGGYARPR
jgi:hypothetical protein